MKSVVNTKRCHKVQWNLPFSARWEDLKKASAERKARLLESREKSRGVDDLFLQFAKRASAFNSWFENVEEDLTDPVRCNSIAEIEVRPSFAVRQYGYFPNLN